MPYKDTKMTLLLGRRSCIKTDAEPFCFFWNLLKSSGVDKRVVSKRVVLADVPPERKPERENIQMFPRNENRNEGTFACSPGTKTGTRVRSPKPPFYETVLLAPNDKPFDISIIESISLHTLAPKMVCLSRGLILLASNRYFSSI